MAAGKLGMLPLNELKLRSLQRFVKEERQQIHNQIRKHSNERTDERTNEPTNQRTNERTNQPTNQRTNEPTNQRTNEPTNEEYLKSKTKHPTRFNTANHREITELEDSVGPPMMESIQSSY
jgi:hypothetical protein